MHPTMKFLITESSAYPQFLSLYVDDFVVLSSRKVIYISSSHKESKMNGGKM